MIRSKRWSRVAYGRPGDTQRVNVEESMPNPNERDQRVIEIVLVSAPRCHFCDDTSKLLEDLSDAYPLSVRKVELASDEGIAIATRYRVPFPPVLLIDGTYFGHGRISRRKLVKALDAAVRFFATEPHPQGGS
jgi:thiol-disulfide isomerase/thioredoxin